MKKPETTKKAVQPASSQLAAAKKNGSKMLRKLTFIVLPLVICVLCLFTGCSTAKNSTLNKSTFPSMPKWGTKDKKPKKDPYTPRTVEEFIAGERPSIY